MAREKAFVGDARSVAWDHSNDARTFGCADAVENLLNRGLAVCILLLSLPVYIPIALAVLITSGHPIIHRGERMGRHKKPYRMFKFRTLVRDAQQIIGDRLLSRDDRVVTRIGWFLRDTRLDELPQLFNILRGDMNFVGPRPVRREVYQELCRNIPGYDKRFRVKPGLIGLSQVFTPHNTPKRIRTLIDHRMMSRRFRPISDVVLIAYTALVVAATTIRHTVGFVPDLMRRRVLRRYREKRRLARVHPNRAAAILQMDGPISRCRAPVVDINDSAFVIVCGEALEAASLRCELIIRVGRNGRTRRISAPCRGNVSQVRSTRHGYEYVINFEPSTERSLYLVHQHFLKRSLAMPPV